MPVAIAARNGAANSRSLAREPPRPEISRSSRASTNAATGSETAALRVPGVRFGPTEALPHPCSTAPGPLLRPPDRRRFVVRPRLPESMLEVYLEGKERTRCQ